jgi:uncharacterized repeat protein (TIGR03803 family)
VEEDSRFEEKIMKNFKLFPYLGIVALVAFAARAQAQTYTDMHDFNNSDGCCAVYPSLLAQGEDGDIYGATTSGGLGFGNIFRITPAGTFNNLFNFDGTHGNGPQGGLSLGFDGNFYGTTYRGGTNHAGTIFKITPSGTQTVLYNFMNTTDGAYPKTAPVQAPDGNLYGNTGNGTATVLYKLTPAGVFSVVLTLPSQSYSPLLVGTDGNLYGMTLLGGTLNAGTAFQFAPTTKKLKIIHNFDVTTGSSPHGPLMQGVDGKLYGTASTGGSSSGGVVFQLSTGGSYKVLFNFSTTNELNGATPFAGVIQGSDGFLYGVTSVGGANGAGLLFKLSTSGTGFAHVHDFATATGDTPYSTPLLHTNGKIYGLAFHGGSHLAYGAIYSLDAGLKPFASQFVYYSGKVGNSVSLLGQGFSNATGVKFGTGPGTFVASTDAFMKATVAAGATTGSITVLEPGGNLLTPQMYKVIPTVSKFTPTSGPVGTKVVITGMSLTQTTLVTFGGVKAITVTVNSDTQVTATVPAGAKTGKIVVKTKGGSATAPGTFTVQ